MALNIRSKKRQITWIYVIASTVVLLILAYSPGPGNEGTTAFYGFLMIMNWIAAYWIAKRLHKSFITVAQCPECDTMLDLFGKWKCTCGYISSRHAFDKCKNCGGSFGYIPCPKCEVAIDI